MVGIVDVQQNREVALKSSVQVGVLFQHLLPSLWSQQLECLRVAKKGDVHLVRFLQELHVDQ